MSGIYQSCQSLYDSLATKEEIKTMPRPKSEMTSVAKTVSARLIPAHYAEWVRLGGVAWLRQQLRESIQKRKENHERI